MREIFVSVDVEASGPIPGEYSMLSLGACVVGAEHERFYVELQPITRNAEPEALAVAGFDLDDLAQRGTPPAEAMAAFDGWIARVTPERHRAIFMAYPVAFDWMFVAWYFHRFLHRNPFGISGLDLRSYYAGMKGTSYTASGKQDMDAQFTAGLALTHNAVEDAVAQARLFDRIRHRS